MQLFKNFNSKIFSKYFFVIAFIFAISLPSKSFAAFTLSGSTITQSGTDTSLAGLSGISGVTTQIVGGATVYRIAGHQLVVTGNLTYDARAQKIEMTGATVSPVFRVNSGGVLTINSLINGKPTYDEAISIRPASSAVQTDFQISQGATFNLNGGKIVTAGTGSNGYQSYFFNKGATINVTDGWIKSYTNQSRWGEAESGSLTNFNINRLIVERVGFTIFGVFGSLSGLSPLNSAVQLVSYGAFPSLSIRDFNPIDGTGSNLDNWDISNVLAYNPISTNINLTGGSFGSNNNRWSSVIKEITVNTKNTSNVNITGASVYIRDTNNGARQNVINIPNQLNDNVYVYSTNGSGITSTIPVYILHGRCSAATVVRDYRTKTTVAGEDLFDIHTWAYGFQYRALSNTALKGNGVLALTSEMLTDTNVTLSEANAITKLASSFSVNTTSNTITVTANSTLDDLYDVMKVYKTRPIQAQLEYPSISTQPVVASGDTVVTAMNLVINTGVTLSSGTKFKKFTTTGAVTVQSGGSNGTTYFDQNGDSIVTFSGIATTSLIQIFSSTGAVLASSTNISNYRYLASSTNFITVKMTRVDNAVLSQKYYLIGGENELPMSLGATEFTNSDRILLQNIYTILNQIYAKVIGLPARVASYFDIIQLLE